VFVSSLAKTVNTYAFSGRSSGQLIEAMLQDKKRANGKMRFSLPAALGDVRIHQVIDDAS